MFGQSRHYINNFEKGFNPIYHSDAVRFGDILSVDPEVFLDDYTRFCRKGYGKKIRKIRSAYALSQGSFAELLGTTRCTESLWEVEYQKSTGQYVTPPDRGHLPSSGESLSNPSESPSPEPPQAGA